MSSRLRRYLYGLAMLTNALTGCSLWTVYVTSTAPFWRTLASDCAHVCDDGFIACLNVKSLQNPVLVRVRMNRRFLTLFRVYEVDYHVLTDLDHCASRTDLTCS